MIRSIADWINEGLGSAMNLAAKINGVSYMPRQRIECPLCIPKFYTVISITGAAVA